MPARGQEVVLPERENLLRQLGLRSKAELREGREGRGRAKDALSRRPRGSECFVINFLSRFLSVATKTGKNNYFYAQPSTCFICLESARANGRLGCIIGPSLEPVSFTLELVARTKEKNSL